VNAIPGVKDSLIVNIEKENGGDYMPLFIILGENTSFEVVSAQVREKLKTEGSPRHQPDEIISVPEVPYTLSGKKMEVPVKKVLMGMEIEKEMNKDAMKNPGAMNFFKTFREEKILS